MSRFSIPSDDIETLVNSANLEENIRKGIIEEFNNSAKGEPHRDLAKRISENYSLSYNDADKICDVFISLLTTKDSVDISDTEIVDEVVAVIEADEDYAESDINLVREWLFSLLKINNPNPLVTSRAYNLAAENHNLYISSNVQEELRPIFLKNEISGLSLYHTLVIHYRREDGRHNNMHLTLDTEDLDSMIELFIKAKERTEVIKSKYGSDVIHI
ncbi:hypothetical protein KXQ82_03300 [Mucilaginibacter sp. HMF5004]|uniref:hypothetical protein n=1 Tax=Mucilaginibacter rivuli TaxID=2857527 RepID=UPI001C5EE540|nr:hypothetical protein [Mucilaginibacter rivuli]MBW4888720.1 hypothetical protein [Mucilaginibacter rivuli]